MNIHDISVPAVYKKSSDFRVLLDWFATALAKIQYDTENFIDLYDPERCPQELLWALADTMGFKYDDRLPASFNRLVLIYFMSMIYNRGCVNGLTLAAEINLAQFKILMQAAGYTDSEGVEHAPEPILYNRLNDTSIPVNSAVVTSHTKEGYIDVVYFSTETPLDACIEYVRPVGMYLFQHAGVKFSARTKISVEARLTNTRDTNMSYGPTSVGHYRRDDYARLQKTIDITSGTNQYPVNDTSDIRQLTWFRNSVAEGEPTHNYAGYRALYSLQLSNNEEVMRALIDPIFSLGFGPTTLEEGGIVEVHDSPEYTQSIQDDPRYNLRYDQTTDEAHTPMVDGQYSIYTIDEDRSPNPAPKYEGKPIPMPAINPIMFSVGEAISLNSENTEYLGDIYAAKAGDFIYETIRVSQGVDLYVVNIIYYLSTFSKIEMPATIGYDEYDRPNAVSIIRATAFNETPVSQVFIPDGVTEIE